MHLIKKDAIEYLDAFIGLFKNASPQIWWDISPSGKRTLKLPLIHVYGWT